MPVLVVYVGKVGVGMPDGVMQMPVRVRLGTIPCSVVIVPVVLVMHVGV
jgi:hypothetical protein